MKLSSKNAEHAKIYNKISSLYGVKFKTQIENSPIEFLNLLFVEDLISENKYYVLIFENQSGSISFQNKVEFIKNFVNYIDVRIQQFEKDFDDLNNFERSSIGIKYCENEVYLRHENIGGPYLQTWETKREISKVVVQFYQKMRLAEYISSK